MQLHIWSEDRIKGSFTDPIIIHQLKFVCMRGELNTESEILFTKSSFFLREGLKFSLVKVVFFKTWGGVDLPNPNPL